MSKLGGCALHWAQKVDTEMGQAPTSQARARDTDHIRPSNMAAKTLAPWSIHPPSLVVTRAFEARTRGGGQVLCVKRTFSLVHQYRITRN